MSPVNRTLLIHERGTYGDQLDLMGWQPDATDISAAASGGRGLGSLTGVARGAALAAAAQTNSTIRSRT